MNEDLLGKCRTCGHRVSRRARKCPECQEPRPTLTEQEFQKTLYDKLQDWLVSPVTDNEGKTIRLLVRLMMVVLVVMFVYMLFPRKLVESLQWYWG